jgi:hypothetical protein
MRLLPFLMLLSSCAALRTGWARVEWMGGEPTAEVVCAVTVKGDEVEMKCVSLASLQEHLLDSYKPPTYYPGKDYL